MGLPRLHNHVNQSPVINTFLFIYIHPIGSVSLENPDQYTHHSQHHPAPSTLLLVCSELMESWHLSVLQLQMVTTSVNSILCVSYNCYQLLPHFRSPARSPSLSVSAGGPLCLFPDTIKYKLSTWIFIALTLNVSKIQPALPPSTQLFVLQM